MQDKVKRYSRIKYSFAIVDTLYLLLLLFLLQSSGFALCLENSLSLVFGNNFLLVFSYCLILYLLYFLLTFPLGFYRSYVVEHRFGLSRQKFLPWLSDQFKELLVGFIIFIILIQGFFFFLRTFPLNWWWISALFWVFFSVILARVFPVLIIPLFFKYKPISDEALRARILNLGKKMGVKVLDVFQIDFSKKTEKANAALVGLGKSKRVILTDTLQGKYTPEEIEVILAHEFSHYRLRHMIKLLILNAATIFLSFYVIFYFSGLILEASKLHLSDVAGLGIWLFCFTLLQIIATPLLNWISRVMEKNADFLALKSSGLKEAFISMMSKLSAQNLSDTNPARWIKVWFYDHPPTIERIKMAERYKHED
ncbi:MAG: M48 family metallopeptidase [Candidatus Omnitrophica bacterium]|nr:M48 family metallopeptidase [Candidatus Omnitrophota bacterium]